MLAELLFLVFVAVLACFPYIVMGMAGAVLLMSLRMAGRGRVAVAEGIAQGWDVGFPLVRRLWAASSVVFAVGCGLLQGAWGLWAFAAVVYLAAAWVAIGWFKATRRESVRG